MSDRGRAAQVSPDGVLLYNAQEALEAFPALSPHLDNRASEIVEVKRRRQPTATGIRLIHEAKSEALVNSGLHTNGPMHSGMFKASRRGMARRIRCPHRPADMYPGKRRRRLCRAGR